MKTKLILLAGLFILQSAFCLRVEGQATAFTYQGLLADGGGAASGIYDLRFAIYDTNSAGALIAGPVTNSATAVSNGLFTVTLDFGNGVFTGPDRWLDIAARTNGAADFTVLTPRQALTPAPYAIYSGSASNLVGTVALTQLPAVVVTNNASGVTLASLAVSGSISGDGSNVTNVNAVTLDGLTATNFWKLGSTNLTMGTCTNTGGYSVALGFRTTASGFNSTALGYQTVASGYNSTAMGEWSLATNYCTTAMGYATHAYGWSATSLGNMTVASGLASLAAGFMANATNPYCFVWADDQGGFVPFGSTTSNQFLIRASNGVGINTNNPQSALHVNGTVTATNFVGSGAGLTSLNAAQLTGNLAATNIVISGTITGDGGGLTNLSASSVASGTLADTVIAGNIVRTNQIYSVLMGLTNLTMSTCTNTGTYSVALGNNSVVGGTASTAQGSGCKATNNYATALGYNSWAYGNASFAAGNLCKAWGSGSTAIGYGSIASNSFSTAIGRSVTASAVYATALGCSSQATNRGAFVWSDPDSSGAASTADDQFLVFASGNVGINTNNPQSTLHVNGSIQWGSSAQLTTDQSGSIELGDSSKSTCTPFIDFHYGVSGTQDYNTRIIADGSEQLTIMRLSSSTAMARFNSSGLTVNGTVVSSSDRNAKENFQPVDASAMLAKVTALPITEWNFKQDQTQRHVGPMAQDFYAAFGVGPDDRHIATVDESGVALAAIQGLNQKLVSQQTRLEQKEAEIADLKARLEKLERLMSRQVGGAQ